MAKRTLLNIVESRRRPRPPSDRLKQALGEAIRITSEHGFCAVARLQEALGHRSVSTTQEMLKRMQQHWPKQVLRGDHHWRALPAVDEFGPRLPVVQSNETIVELVQNLSSNLVVHVVAPWVGVEQINRATKRIAEAIAKELRSVAIV